MLTKNGIYYSFIYFGVIFFFVGLSWLIKRGKKQNTKNGKKGPSTPSKRKMRSGIPDMEPVNANFMLNRSETNQQDDLENNKLNTSNIQISKRRKG